MFTSPKSSPLGTFTGTQIFGARGVVYINPASADTQAYILTDDLGTLNNPPNTVAFNVTNAAVGDRVLAARDTGTAGVIDKDQFGGLAAPSGLFNGLADLVIRMAGTLDAEVPQSGYVRVVDTGPQQEHHYVYDSLDLTNEEFDLRVVDIGDGTVDGGTNETTLINSGAAFNTAPLAEPGMLIRNGTNGDDVYEVVSVDSDTQLTIVKLYGAGTWTTGDAFTLNALIGDHTGPSDYGTDDDAYDLILDAEVTSGTSIQNTFVKTPAADFGVVVNVRQGKIILPFTLNQTQSDGTTTVTVVRQPDTIAV